MAHEAGKGSAQRPTNHQAFSDAFDRIFGTTQRQLGHVDADDASKENVDEDEENEHEDGALDYCDACSGSGEGMYDGATCGKCHGSGVEPVEKDDDI